MENRNYNFSPGPAVLPLSVLQTAQKDLLCYPGAGASVMEISHRSKTFEAILGEAKGNLKQLLQIPDGYRIMFLQGGATLQFAMAPMNLLGGKSADYIVTGSWGSKAVKEAEKVGRARTAWSGKAENFTRLPDADELELDPDAAYVHFTSNETIQGVEFMEEPETGVVPLVCDASSDILSRPLPVERYGLIYAGAQKNAGPAGVTLVILREDLLARVPEALPSLLNYKELSDNDSLLNTPPCFAVYIVMLTTRWLLKEIGGLERMQAINQKKAKLLYDVIDQSGGYYKGHAAPGCRSLMNVTWRMDGEEREKAFLEAAKKEGLVELKGHPPVGGMRASLL